MRLHSRGTICPSFALAVTLESQRAQGMPGAWSHPQPCVQLEKHASKSPQVRRTFRHSLREWFYGLYVFSPVYRPVYRAC